MLSYKFTLQTACLLLIQDAAQERRFRHHSAPRTGLTRAPGILMHIPQGEPVGTLCILNKVPVSALLSPGVFVRISRTGLFSRIWL
jgi:hypothetical protein